MIDTKMFVSYFRTPCDRRNGTRDASAYAKEKKTFIASASPEAGEYL